MQTQADTDTRSWRSCAHGPWTHGPGFVRMPGPGARPSGWGTEAKSDRSLSQRKDGAPAPRPLRGQGEGQPSSVAGRGWGTLPEQSP